MLSYLTSSITITVFGAVSCKLDSNCQNNMYLYNIHVQCIETDRYIDIIIDRERPPPLRRKNFLLPKKLINLSLKKKHIKISRHSEKKKFSSENATDVLGWALGPSEVTLLQVTFGSTLGIVINIGWVRLSLCH